MPVHTTSTLSSSRRRSGSGGADLGADLFAPNCDSYHDLLKSVHRSAVMEPYWRAASGCDAYRLLQPAHTRLECFLGYAA